MSIGKNNAFDMLLVIKPVRILIFVIIWNILCFTGIWLNGGLGKIKTPGAYVCLILAGAFAAFSGFAPVLSPKYRQRWCKPDIDFSKGRFGLIFLGALGSCFVIVGLVELLSKIGI